MEKNKNYHKLTSIKSSQIFDNDIVAYEPRKKKTKYLCTITCECLIHKFKNYIDNVNVNILQKKKKKITNSCDYI